MYGLSRLLQHLDLFCLPRFRHGPPRAGSPPGFQTGTVSTEKRAVEPSCAHWSVREWQPVRAYRRGQRLVPSPSVGIYAGGKAVRGTWRARAATGRRTEGRAAPERWWQIMSGGVLVCWRLLRSLPGRGLLRTTGGHGDFSLTSHRLVTEWLRTLFEKVALQGLITSLPDQITFDVLSRRGAM